MDRVESPPEQLDSVRDAPGDGFGCEEKEGRVNALVPRARLRNPWEHMRACSRAKAEAGEEGWRRSGQEEESVGERFSFSFSDIDGRCARV